MRLTIPENTSEIKLGDYQKYVSVVSDTDNEDFQKSKMIELFCGVSFSYVEKMPLVDREETIDILNKAFTAKRKPFRYYKRFKLDGKEFGFIPDLERIKVKENTDISLYLGDNENLHKLMAVMYRPTTETTRDLYSIEAYQGSDRYSDVMKQVPLDICLEASAFFFYLMRDLLNAIHQSTDKQVMEVADLVRKRLLQNNGDGILPFTQLPGVTY